MARVLRKKVNDEIRFFDGHGNQYKGKILKIDLKTLTAGGEILSYQKKPSTSLKVHLYQGLPKGSKFDFIIEKATELGVYQITPFLSQKNVIKLKDSSSHNKLARWNRVAEAAAKQCGRPTIPHLNEPVLLRDVGAQFQKNSTVVLHPSPESQSLKMLLRNDLLKDPILNIIIGPESGFDKDEIQWLSKVGVAQVSLGDLILRTETAGLALLSILNYENSL